MALVELVAEIRFHNHRCQQCHRGWRMVVWPGTTCLGQRWALCPICAAALGRQYCGQPEWAGRTGGAPKPLPQSFQERWFAAPQAREIGGIRIRQ